MFQVKNKESGQVFTVYAVSGTMFLIFDRRYTGGVWIWTPMDEYEPA